MFMVTASMFSQIYLVIFALDAIKESMIYHGTFSAGFKEFFVWLCLEAIILASALFANALFLLTRSCFSIQNALSFANQGRHTESDFLEARTTEIGLISSWVTTFFVTLLITMGESRPIYQSLVPDHSDSSFNLMVTIAIIQGLQVLNGLFFFFVHFFQGWERNEDCWMKFGPIIHRLCAWINYIIAPISIYFLQRGFYTVSGSTVFSAVFWFFDLTAVANLVVWIRTWRGYIQKAVIEAKIRQDLRFFKAFDPDPEFAQNCQICLGGVSSAQDKDSRLMRLRTDI